MSRFVPVLSRRSLARTVIPVMACLLHAGCGSLQVKGRVIEGVTSFATVVPGSDVRLQEPSGIANASIEFRTERGEVFGSGRSDSSGRFTLSVNDRVAPKGTMQLDASAPGYLPARALIYIPRDGRSVLVTMRRGGGQAGPVTKE